MEEASLLELLLVSLLSSLIAMAKFKLQQQLKNAAPA